MQRIDPVVLRLELLRVRAAIERAELRAAVLDLRASTAPVRSLIGLVSGGKRSRDDGFAVMVRAAVELLRERPWLLSTVAAFATRRRAWRWLVPGALALLVAMAVRRAAGPAAARESEAPRSDEPAATEARSSR